jgi:AcrR family transcriptional regulator
LHWRVQGKIIVCNYKLLNGVDGGTLAFMPTAPPSRIPAPQARGEIFTSTVLDTTLTELAEVGFERLSIPKVANIAGVNKTSIYRRWPSKADLVRDALGIAMSHTEQAPNTGALRTDLIALAGTVAAFTQSRVGTALIRIMLAEGGNPEVRALANAAYSEAGKQGPWIVIKHAMQRSEIAPHVNPSHILFTIAGAIMHRVFVEHTEPSKQYLEQIVDLVLYGASNGAAKAATKRAR